MNATTMKALVYTANQEMTYRDEPIPELKAGEALIRTDLVGVCGSDMHAYLGHDERRIPPLILGHEVVGVVVQGTNPGQRVVVNPLVVCGQCHNCLSGRQNLCPKRDIIGMYRPGAFSELFAMPEINLIPIPDDMSVNHAVLAEPGATALHATVLAQKALTRPISESTALVIGSGSVGLLTALILLDKGVSRVDIHETNPLRIALVSKHIDCHIINPLTTPPQTDCYDVVFDCVGSANTRKASFKGAKPGSVIVHVGLQDSLESVDIRRLTLQEITLIGCYTYTPTDFQAIINKLHQGALGSLEWVQQQPLAQGGQTFKSLLKGQCAAPKVVFKP